MAKKFEFASVKETLDIAGHIYQVDCNSEQTLAALSKFGGNCTELTRQGSNYSDAELAKKSIIEMTNFLNAVLGEGTCDEIFAIRGKNYHDMFSVSVYVCESIRNARNRHTENEAKKKKTELEERDKKKGKGKNRKGKTHKMTARVLKDADKYTVQSTTEPC